MFTRSARFYDALYGFKDYRTEAEQVHRLIQEHKRSAGTALLDVGCGTGGHLAHLREHYAVEGLDLDAGLLAIARERNPELRLHQADMADFDLGRAFDAIVCLFSSIGYVKTIERLRQTLCTFAHHLAPGGVVVLEPWLAPEVYRAGRLFALFVDQPGIKIARMNVTALEDGVSVLDFHYLVATPAGLDHFTERHELALFSDQDYRAAFAAAGLGVIHLAEGITDRGVYVGTRP